MIGVELLVWPAPALNGGETDYKRACAKLLEIPEATRPTIAQMFDETRRLLRECKPAMRAVAEQLLERDRLTYREVLRTLTQARSIGTDVL